MDRPQTKRICSYKNVLIAKGYQRVVCTQQGMYWEFKWRDVVFENLQEKLINEDGERRWFSKGVTLYQWSGSYKHVLRPHRFAVVPTDHEGNYEQVHPDRYYAHVYQTKIEDTSNELKTLQSRLIAQELESKLGTLYWPRPNDLPTLNISLQNNLKGYLGFRRNTSLSLGIIL